MSQYIFGAGILWATPLADAFGNAIVNGTPVQLMVSQEVSMDESFETKMLYGQNQYPVDVGRGKGKMSVKAKFGQVNGLVISSLFYGQTLNTGLRSFVFDTSGSVIPGTPYAVTPTVPVSGTWAYDVGVRDANGRPMTKVASAPATGQYMVSAGVYTFAAADTTKQVFISYAYTVTGATAGVNMNIVNIPMGTAPLVKLDIYFNKNGKTFATTFPNAIASKLAWQSKLDDYMVPEIDFDVFADPAGNVMYRSLSE